MTESYFQRVVRAVQANKTYAAWALGALGGIADRFGVLVHEDLLVRAEAAETWEEARAVVLEADPRFFCQAEDWIAQ